MFLVTGVAGFIGRSIAAELLQRGERVRGIDNLCTGKLENLTSLNDLEFLEADLNDADAVAKVCTGVDVIFHEAALPSVPRSVKDPWSSNEANVSGTLRLLMAARAAGVRRIVYAGSSSAYGESPTLPKVETMLPAPISPYAVSKLTGNTTCSLSRVSMDWRPSHCATSTSSDPIRTQHLNIPVF